MSYNPIAFGWSLEDTTNAFDAVGAPWYVKGVNQFGPLVAVRDRNEKVQWVDPSAMTTIRSYGRQRPMIVLSYFLMNGLPVYHAMGNKAYSDNVHTFSFGTSATRLPKYQVRYQNSDGIVNTIWENYNCITHTLNLRIARDNPMIAQEIIVGRDRWIADNSTWGDGQTTAYGYTSMMNDPILYTGTNTSGFYLDSNSIVNVGVSGSEVNLKNFLYSMEINLSLIPIFQYVRADTFREEIFPSDIFELYPVVPLTVDIDVIQGVENSLLKGILENTNINISAKFYSDTTNYIQFDCSSSKHNEAFVSIPKIYETSGRVFRMRFMGDYTGTIKLRDGVTSIEAHQ